jgi:hypothetical protein
MKAAARNNYEFYRTTCSIKNKITIAKTLNYLIIDHIQLSSFLY